MPRKVVVIGAGIAGLSAGVYARRAGFDVEVFEAHTIPGGLCTAWRRGGFMFDGCVHYLVGTAPGSPFHRLWSEVGAVQGRAFVYPEALVTAMDLTGRTAHLYCDPARLEDHLASISPADAPAARTLCRLVRTLERFSAPVAKARELMGILDGLQAVWAMRGMARELAFCFGVSVGEFAARFQDPLLRRLLESTMDPRSPLLNLVVTLGDLALRRAGYPIGGSLPLARAIEARLLALGGKVSYGTRVAQVLVRAGRAVGVELADGAQIDADCVIAAADLRRMLDALAGAGVRSQAHEELFQREIHAAPTIQVSLGLTRKFPQPAYTVANVAELARPIATPALSLDWIGWSNHDHDPTLAPAEGSVITSLVPAEFGRWERMGHQTPEYEAAKASVAEAVSSALEERMPGLRGAIEEVDVATPLTFQRYTGNHHGAYMSWLGKVQQKCIPKDVPGAEGLLLAGMWVAPPGGLPGAVKSARDAVQILCKRSGIDFGRAVD
jgi:phytoene dehydrogenase-like protein